MSDTTNTTTETDVPVSEPVITGQLVTTTPVSWVTLNLTIKAKTYQQLQTEFEKISAQLAKFDGSANASYEDTLDEFGSNSNVQYYITN